MDMKQVIKHGHLNLEIPSNMTAMDAIGIYAATYPELAFAKLSDGRIENDMFVYEVQRDKSIGTKG
jgi:hypothetical protein